MDKVICKSTKHIKKFENWLKTLKIDMKLGLVTFLVTQKNYAHISHKLGTWSLVTSQKWHCQQIGMNVT
jgi:hypothetical protein